MGIDFLGIPDSKIFLQAMLALIFLIIAFFAWRGQPPLMSYALMLACAGLTLLNILYVVVAQLSQQNLAAGVSSLELHIELVITGPIRYQSLSDLLCCVVPKSWPRQSLLSWLLFAYACRHSTC